MTGHLEALMAELEADARFSGKLVRDIPGVADFRRRWRWIFYRLADAGFFLLILNLSAALAGPNPAWVIALIFAGLNLWLIFFSERRARIISRQLNRPASLQLARDLLGIAD